jgi:dipeptidyl aminopeptidase/acylaminoacyl peptidase
VTAPPPELRDLLQCRTTAVLDDRRGHDGEVRLLLRSDLSGTAQLYEWDAGALRQLTDLDGPVPVGRYVPGSEHVVLSTDTRGDERHQLSLLDLQAPPLADRSLLQPVTADPRFVHSFAGISADGGTLAFTSNRRNGVDFDVWVSDLATGEQRCVYDGGGWCMPASGFSPDGRRLSVLRTGPRPMDTDLLLLDVTGAGGADPVVVLAHPDEAAVVGAPAWVDDDLLLVSSNVGRDTQALFAVDLAHGSTVVVVERDHDVDGWTSADGSTLLVVENVDEASRAELFRLERVGGVLELDPVGPVPLPEEAVVAFSHVLPDPVVAWDGEAVTFSVCSPTVPGDVWRYVVGTGALNRMTTSPGAPEADALVRPERHVVPSFDGLGVPELL